MSAALETMTREEFFVWAEAQDTRHEFDGFRPVAMTGGSMNHDMIANNLRFELVGKLRGGSCRPLGPDAGVATPGNKVRYPEAVVTCSEVPGRDRLVPNPVVVFEVVSPGSIRIDQVIKLREYRAVPSVKRYVVVEQDGAALIVHARQHDESWTTTPLVAGDVLALPEIGIEIPVNAIYNGIRFGEQAPPC